MFCVATSSSPSSPWPLPRLPQTPAAAPYSPASSPYPYSDPSLSSYFALPPTKHAAAVEAIDPAVNNTSTRPLRRVSPTYILSECFALHSALGQPMPCLALLPALLLLDHLDDPAAFCGCSLLGSLRTGKSPSSRERRHVAFQLCFRWDVGRGGWYTGWCGGEMGVVLRREEGKVRGGGGKVGLDVGMLGRGLAESGLGLTVRGGRTREM